MVFTLIILYFSLNVRNNTIADSKEIVDCETRRYANLIQNMFDVALSITGTFTDAFIENKVLQSQQRDTINKKILLNSLEKNDDFLSVWLHYELSALYPDYNKKNGRVRNVAYRLNNKLFFAQNIADTTNEELSSLYYDVKKGKKTIISDPYYDTHTPELKGILMVSPISPIMLNGEFLGMVGVDLTLEKIQQMVQTVNPFESSVAYLVAPNNKIVAHSDNNLFNKDLIEINKTYEKEFKFALTQIRKNKTYKFEINRSNKDVYISFSSISVG